MPDTLVSASPLLQPLLNSLGLLLGVLAICLLLGTGLAWLTGA